MFSLAQRQLVPAVAFYARRAYRKPLEPATTAAVQLKGPVAAAGTRAGAEASDAGAPHSGTALIRSLGFSPADIQQTLDGIAGRRPVTSMQKPQQQLVAHTQDYAPSKSLGAIRKGKAVRPPKDEIPHLILRLHVVERLRSEPDFDWQAFADGTMLGALREAGATGEPRGVSRHTTRALEKAAVHVRRGFQTAAAAATMPDTQSHTSRRDVEFFLPIARAVEVVEARSDDSCAGHRALTALGDLYGAAVVSRAAAEGLQQCVASRSRQVGEPDSIAKGETLIGVTKSVDTVWRRAVGGTVSALAESLPRGPAKEGCGAQWPIRIAAVAQRLLAALLSAAMDTRVTVLEGCRQSVGHGRGDTSAPTLWHALDRTLSASMGSVAAELRRLVELIHRSHHHHHRRSSGSFASLEPEWEWLGTLPGFSGRQLSAAMEVVSDCVHQRSAAFRASSPPHGVRGSQLVACKRSVYTALLAYVLQATTIAQVYARGGGASAQHTTGAASAEAEAEMVATGGVRELQPVQVVEAMAGLCESLWRIVAPPLRRTMSDRLVVHTTIHSSLNLRLARLQQQIPIQRENDGAVGPKGRVPPAHPRESWITAGDAVLLLSVLHMALIEWLGSIQCAATNDEGAQHLQRQHDSLARFLRAALEVEVELSFLARARLLQYLTRWLAKAPSVFAVPTQIERFLIGREASTPGTLPLGTTPFGVEDGEETLWGVVNDQSRVLREVVASVIFTAASVLAKHDLHRLASPKGAPPAFECLMLPGFIGFMKGSLFPLLRRHAMAAGPGGAASEQLPPRVLAPCLGVFQLLKSVFESQILAQKPQGEAKSPTAVGHEPLVCGVPLGQAADVAYFMVSFIVNEPVSEAQGLENVLASAPKVNSTAAAVAELVTRATVASYVAVVLHAMDHNTAKQLWHLKSTSRLDVGKTAPVQSASPSAEATALSLPIISLFAATPESGELHTWNSVALAAEVADSEWRQNSSAGAADSNALGALLCRDGLSLLSVVHSHVMHPSFYWMPLQQVQEFVFMLSCFPELLAHRKAAVAGAEGGVAAPGDDNDGDGIARERAITVPARTTVVQRPSVANRARRDAAGRAAAAMSDGGEGKMDDQAAASALRSILGDDGSEAKPVAEPPSHHPAIVERHFARAHGYLVLRLAVLSRAMREYQRLCRLAARKFGPKRSHGNVKALSLKGSKPLGTAEMALRRAVHSDLTSPLAAHRAASVLFACYPTVPAITEGQRLPTLCERRGGTSDEHGTLAAADGPAKQAAVQLRRAVLRGSRRTLQRLESTVQLAVQHSLLINVKKDRQRRRQQARQQRASAQLQQVDVLSTIFSDAAHSAPSTVESDSTADQATTVKLVLHRREGSASGQSLGFSLDGLSLAVRRVEWPDSSASAAPNRSADTCQQQPLPPFPAALRAAGLTPSDVVGWHVTHVGEVPVATAKDVGVHSRGRKTFTITLSRPTSGKHTTGSSL